jgi:hypothetical protein
MLHIPRQTCVTQRLTSMAEANSGKSAAGSTPGCTVRLVMGLGCMHTPCVITQQVTPVDFCTGSGCVCLREVHPERNCLCRCCGCVLGVLNPSEHSPQMCHTCVVHTQGILCCVVESSGWGMLIVACVCRATCGIDRVKSVKGAGCAASCDVHAAVHNSAPNPHALL